MADAAATRQAGPAGFDPAWRLEAAATFSAIGVGDPLTVVLLERDGVNVFAAGPDGFSRFDGLSVVAGGRNPLVSRGRLPVCGPTSVLAAGRWPPGGYGGGRRGPGPGRNGHILGR